MHTVNVSDTSASFRTEASQIDNLTLNADGSTTVYGQLLVSTAGKGLSIEASTATNTKLGTTAAMSGTPGAVTVTNSAVTANSVILYNRKTTGGTPGHVSYTISAGVSFTLTSTGNETSTFDYMIVEKA